MYFRFNPRNIFKLYTIINLIIFLVLTVFYLKIIASNFTIDAQRHKKETMKCWNEHFSDERRRQLRLLLMNFEVFEATRFNVWLSQFRFWSTEAEFFHRRMLMTYRESIDMNRNRNDNFTASVWRSSSTAHTVWCQSCFYTFPFSATVLKPNFYLWILSELNLYFLRKISKLTWTSLSFNVVAIWLLSVKLKYFLAWNSLSSSSNCSLVNAVLRRRDLIDFGPSPEFSGSSSSSSLSEHSDSELHNSKKNKKNVAKSIVELKNSHRTEFVHN